MRHTIAACILLVSGCATPILDEAYSSVVEPGPAEGIAPPTSYSEMEEAVRAAVGRKLIDPYSAQYELLNPVNVNVSGKVMNHTGWLVCGTVNAKNRFGAYVGRTSFVAFFSTPSVAEAILDTENIKFASDVCQKGYTNPNVQSIKFSSARYYGGVN